MDLDLSKVIDIRLLSVEQHGEVLVIQREMVFEDGSTVPGKHVMPADTLEWRAAEYDIDPMDTDTLLDIVLWEPFLADDDQPELSLHEAPTIEEARVRHLQRITARKGKAAQRRPGAPDMVREKIKSLSVMNLEAVALKRELTGRARADVRKDKERRAKERLRALALSPAEERVARLRASLARGQQGHQHSMRRTPTHKEILNG